MEPLSYGNQKEMVFFVRNITLDSFRKTKRPYSLIESTARLRVIKIIRYVHFPLPQNELQVHRDALSVLMGFFVYGAERLCLYADMRLRM